MLPMETATAPRRKLDRRKLEAVVRDAASAPAEKAFAQRLLDEMGNRGESDAAMIGARESWEVTLLEMLAERHALAMVEDGASGFFRVSGDVDALHRMITDLIRLQPQLEALIISTTAGFLSVHFPQKGRATGPEDPVLAAARAATRAGVKNKGPAQLAGSSFLRLPGPAKSRD